MGEQESAAVRGRDALVGWKADQPTNYFTSDTDLQRLLARLWGAEKYAAHQAALERFGGVCATVVEPLVSELEWRGNMPRLERWDAIGRRTEEVVYDERAHVVGRHLYGSGVIGALGEAGNSTYANALLYLSNQNGEAGHNCPIVCTMGLVRALREAASDEIKARYLPGLLDSDYDAKLDGAQFVTEVQGGSDVGANAVVATPSGRPGEWLITGEKWFCSNASADLMLVTARPEGSPDGTRGLGLFLVPRRLPDGTLNQLFLRRLKDKLGTRAMASGEMDFDGAVGYPVGPVQDGFKTMMNHVINTSRLSNAAGTLSMARRALIVAWTYAGRREAFGAPIRRYPLVQETLADMRTEQSVLMAGHVHLCDLRDRIDRGQATAQEAGFFRVALNLNKYRTAVSSGEVIRSGIEILGGNGAIESFSPLPRLLRDNIVYENWEGTHNTLAMQVLRDMARLGVGADFVSCLSQRFAALAGGPLDLWAERGRTELDTLAGALRELAGSAPDLASLRIRPLCDSMAWLMAGAAQAEQAAWDIEHHDDPGAEAVLEWFWERRITGRSPLPDQRHLDRLGPLVERI